MSRPWFRLYRKEEGAFAQLPLLARAIAAELLKLTDDTGVIQLGRKEPVEAIAFQLGATRSDRRALATYVPMLLEDGYIVHEGATLRVPGFPRFQADATSTEQRPRRDATSTTPRTSADAVTTEPRPSNEPTSTEQRTDLEDMRKSPESLDGTDGALREERRDSETDGEEKTRAPAPKPRHVEAFERSLVTPTDRDSAVAALISDVRVELGGARFRPLSWADREMVSKLREWGDAQPDPDAAIRAVLLAFFAAKATGARLSWLTDEDPGRFLGDAPKRARAGSDYRPSPPRSAFRDDDSELVAAEQRMAQKKAAGGIG